MRRHVVTPETGLAGDPRLKSWAGIESSRCDGDAIPLIICLSPFHTHLTMRRHVVTLETGLASEPTIEIVGWD